MGKSMLNGVCYGSDSATDINYDNTSSGMSATNTQDAIDELNESLSNNITTVNNSVTTLKNSLGTQVTFSLSGTTLTITSK